MAIMPGCPAMEFAPLCAAGAILRISRVTVILLTGALDGDG